jgi:16S rRNA C967 or C1407 C5-methylase (RsmB/RsmF family)
LYIILDKDSSMTLPQDFIEDMRQIMPPSEWEAFLSSFEEERSFGLRFNPLKGISQENWKEIMPFSLEPVPWSREGYFYQDEERPGKHVLHEMGAYYIQEPSAMIVTELLDPKPGEKILDLCAAPGGKSTQIGAKLEEKGIRRLYEGQSVSYEPYDDRGRIAAGNIILL